MPRPWPLALLAFVLCLQPPRPAAAEPNALVLALLKPDLAKLTPVAAIKRFAKFIALERAQPVPSTLLLAGGDMQQRLELRYEANADGKQRFAQAALRFASADPAAHHRELQQTLNKKLGEPRYERRDDGPLPSIGWRLGQLEIALSQITVRDRPWLEVSVANPR